MHVPLRSVSRRLRGVPGLKLVKKASTLSFLAGRALQARLLLRGRSGPRIFDRIRIVAAMCHKNGITSGAYLQWQALDRLGFDVELIDATDALRNPLVCVEHRPGSMYVFHCGGPQTASLLTSVLPQAADAYRVGYWAWELPDPPKDWYLNEGLVSEIWTPSGFAQASLARRFDLPIRIVPHFLSPRLRRQRSPQGPFTVLVMADSRSSFSRKNPAGAVAAFERAFGSAPSAKLVLKLNGRAEDIEELTRQVDRLPNVEVVRDYLDDAGLERLYRSADVMLSLHRAEGFGLPMLEAMSYGIPVVGTGWSGNLEFMDASNSVLVPYRLVRVFDQNGIYSGTAWAEPGIEAAADALKRLATDHDYYSRLAAAAHAKVARDVFKLPVSEDDACAPAETVRRQGL
jgi:glycosyltransferase involved in cell wall biosynthesis